MKVYTAPKDKMTNGELKEYLNKFTDDVGISVILANPRDRKMYKCVNAFGVIDTPNPTFCMDVGEEKPMDEELVMETFFERLKNEMFYGHEKDYASLEDFSKAIEEYICKL